MKLPDAFWREVNSSGELEGNTHVLPAVLPVPTSPGRLPEPYFLLVMGLQAHWGPWSRAPQSSDCGTLACRPFILVSAVTLQRFGAGSRVQPARAGFKSSSAAPAGQPGVPCHPFPLHLLRLPGLLVPALASPRAAFPYASLLLYPWPAMLLAQWGSFSRNVHFCMKYRPQGGKKWDIDLVPYVETLEQSPQPPAIHSSQVT